jgi:hypothetical protein
VKPSRVATILWKDLSKGPRSPFFLWILVMPLMLTLLCKGVFGALFERPPVLGVVAPDGAAVLRALTERPGLEVRRVPDAETLWRLVDEGEVELGWVVPPGFEDALPREPLPMLVVFAVAGLMLVELGLLLGARAKDTTVLFTIWKGSAWLLMLPLVALLWSGFPRWVAMLSPTWWFISPTWKVAMEGKGLADVGLELGVALGFVVVLFVAVRLAARRVERTIGAA